MARLPEPGSDKGTWGSILNEYLSASLDTDGTLKDSSVTANTIASNAVTSSAIAPNSITTTQLAADSVNATIIVDGSITQTQLSTGVQSKINGAYTKATSGIPRTDLASDVQSSLANADAAVAGAVADATSTTKGIVRLTGGLAGTADAPLIAANAIADAQISSSAAIAQSKVSGLTTALAAKEPALTAGTTGQYLRGDKTFQTLDKTAVGLSLIDNTSDLNKPVSTATQTALGLKATTSTLSAVATSGSYTDLLNKPTIPTIPVTSVASRTGDIVLTKSDVNLSSVDNTSDLSKPVSTATQTALNLKATTSTLSTVATSGSYADLLNKPVIPTVPVTSVASRTGDISLTKADVGLTNVDNTSDTAKPVSTATQTLLDAKLATSGLDTATASLVTTSSSATATAITAKVNTAIAGTTNVYMLAPADPDPIAGSPAGLYFRRTS